MKPVFDATLPVSVAIAGAWLLAVGVLIGLGVGEHRKGVAELERTIKDLQSRVEEAISKMPSVCLDGNDDTISPPPDDVQATFCSAGYAAKPIGSVCFDHDSAIPLADAQGICVSRDSDEKFYSIEKLTRRLEKEKEKEKENPEHCCLVLVEGHANSIGSVTHNLDLSEDRTKAVISGLRKKLSDDSWRFRSISRGESHGEPNPARGDNANRKASVSLCLPVPVAPQNEIQKASE